MMKRFPTNALSLLQEAKKTAGIKSQPAPGLSSQWTVSLRARVQADARRLFNALTVPEYLEAWIALPDHRPGCSNVVSRVEHEYSIAHCCGGLATAVIAGAYLVCQRHKLVLSWRVEAAERAKQTLVDIRLHGDFECTTVLLTHRGFDSRETFLWHKALWSVSLERLAGLYAGPSRGKMNPLRAGRKAGLEPSMVTAS